MLQNKKILIILSVLAFPLASIFGHFTYCYLILGYGGSLPSLGIEGLQSAELSYWHNVDIYSRIFAVFWLIPTSIVAHFSAKHLRGKGTYLQDFAALSLALALVDSLIWLGWLGGASTFYLIFTFCFFPYMFLYGWLLEKKSWIHYIPWHVPRNSSISNRNRWLRSRIKYIT